MNLRLRGVRAFLAAFLITTVVAAVGRAAEVAAPAPKAMDTDAVAIVNGQAILRTELIDLLMQRYGPELLEVLIREKLVEQAAAKRGLICTPTELEARLQEEVQNQMLAVAKRYGLNDVSALAQELLRANLSIEVLRRETEAQLRPHVRPGVLLEKLAADVQVTDDDIRQAFQEQYGPRAIVRQVVFASLAEAEEGLSRLKSGADFLALVREKSIDPVTRGRGGEMPPLPSLGTLGEAAFKLQPGQFSAVLKTDDGYHILRLERLQPAQDVKFEDVRDSLRGRVLRARARERMPRVLDELVVAAKVERRLPEAP